MTFDEFEAKHLAECKRPGLKYVEDGDEIIAICRECSEEYHHKVK